jgi:hypothetical protein
MNKSYQRWHKMKKTLSRISLFSSKINRRKLQIFLALLTLALLALGAGAPGMDGGVGGI